MGPKGELDSDCRQQDELQPNSNSQVTQLNK
jgi:hypothetical protein